MTDSDEVFEVESLIDYRQKDGKDHFEVQWKGFKETTWEPDENIPEDLKHMKDAIKQRVLGGAPQGGKAARRKSREKGGKKKKKKEKEVAEGRKRRKKKSRSRSSRSSSSSEESSRVRAKKKKKKEEKEAVAAMMQQQMMQQWHYAQAKQCAAAAAAEISSGAAFAATTPGMAPEPVSASSTADAASGPGGTQLIQFVAPQGDPFRYNIVTYVSFWARTPSNDCTRWSMRVFSPGRPVSHKAI
eukprot:TRINITY_DN2849_c1_g1_i2.p1 TRINITY_DN2849_c1_g1~~TRINITY_DN2849_c1_g1_i2.p1  ORF type:complete len:243 (-),score=63.51 TRINITY_DN2849_c1_g1_i2:213-941(-)